MFTTGSFTNGRGQTLATVRCVPADGVIKAVVHYHHGLGDYAMRNEPLFKYLAGENIATLSFDAAGHGDSDPQPPEPRHAIKRFSNVVNDALLHVKKVLLPFCQANCNGAPVFLLGSSMGALASVLLAEKPEIKALPMIKGLILNAAAIDAHRTWITRIQEPLAGFANLLIPMWGFVPASDPTRNHREPAELEKREADDKLDKGALKVCTACAMLDGFEAAQEVPEALTLPILALHGEKDQVCPVGHVEEFLSRVGSSEVVLKKFPEGLHDMLHDYEKDEVRKEIVSFILGKLN